MSEQALTEFVGVLEISLQSPECTDVIPEN
jgi:hypothetical protein